MDKHNGINSGFLMYLDHNVLDSMLKGDPHNVEGLLHESKYTPVFSDENLKEIQRSKGYEGQFLEKLKDLTNMNCSNSIIFELYQDTVKFKQGIVLLKAGSNSITNIDGGNSLFLKFDGKTYSFESVSPVTEHETIYFGYGASIPFSYKTYTMPDAIVKEAASSKEFLAKMNLLNNTFIEGKCSPVTLEESKEQYKAISLNITQEHVDAGNKFAAINGFREFVKMMQTTSW